MLPSAPRKSPSAPRKYCPYNFHRPSQRRRFFTSPSKPGKSQNHHNGFYLMGTLTVILLTVFFAKVNVNKNKASIYWFSTDASHDVLYWQTLQWSGAITWNIQKQPPDVFLKKRWNFTKFTGNHLCQSLFFSKVAGLSHVK